MTIRALNQDQPLLLMNGGEENEDYKEDSSKKEDEKEGFLQAKERIQKVLDGLEVVDDPEPPHHFPHGVVPCITLYSLHPRHSNKRGEQISSEQYGLWRQEQKSRAAMLEQQLRARWALEETIHEQLKRFDSHYNCARVPTRLEDVAELLMPKWAPPLEMASVGWLGDWRPSAILELVQTLIQSSYLSSSLADSDETDQILSRLIREIRIEETVLDEEMSEIQAKCILHLPFSPTNCTSISPLALIQSELKKIKQVIIRAQQLRFKVLELVVKKVLSQVDAAEFLVAFAGIQDAIHQFAARQKFHKSSLNVSVKALRTV